MSFYQTCLILFLLSFSSCKALRCTTECSFSYNTSTSFIYPQSCNQIVSAGKCGANLAFTFGAGDNLFQLTSFSTNSIYNSNNQRRGKLQIINSAIISFTHYVDITCKDKDDCAKDLAMKITNEILQRPVDFTKILNELEPFIIGPSLTMQNRQLNCYNSNEQAEICIEYPNRGSCASGNTITSNKLTRSCQSSSYQPEISIAMYQDSSIATFDILCTRNLCNTQSILNSVKDILFRYNITQTPDGRLTGSTFHVSILLILIMIFITFLNYRE
ncbi:hypothetical protein I4U23_005834 [Adineta vaga]|nr:hypothetical protein I4U23_005834 [Adineta vaga]